MSLKYGGRYDFNSLKGEEFQAPHQLHMFGEHVDIHSQEHTTEQKNWILSKANKGTLAMELENKGEDDEHFHAKVK